MPERRARRRSGVRAGAGAGAGGVGSDRRLRVRFRGAARVLFLDVDGTLTDGVITVDAQGDSRPFWIRDGLSMQWAEGLGIKVVVVSGRASAAVEARMHDLAIECYVGIQDKVAIAERVLAREGAEWAQSVMVGDDLPDIPMMKRVGWAVAVADAQPEVRAVAHARTRRPGGRGAVREVVEALLRHNGVWTRVLERYEVGGPARRRP